MTHFALSLLAAAALVGCGSAVKLDEPPPVETRPVDSSSQANAGNAANTKPMGESTVKTVDLGAQLTAAVANQRVVYFDFDSFTVKEDYRGLVEAHAKRLSNDRKVSLNLEGHTDERGGREYNLALGQKRAEAVAKSLTLLGVNGTQVEAVSFGKERPADTGHDEAAWAKNRRVELKDK
ncbi:peptidoglycan-associated lipoprotein Pal [Roseateles koreensis]|nr:peptidoglycan-associated lipoprotein Pal [Roseateles koreensis]